MHDEPAAQRMKAQMEALNSALCDLRDGLTEMSLLLQELALHQNNAAARTARTEASDLLQRLRG